MNNIKEIFLSIRLASHSLRGNVGRTILSTIGIVIGVVSIILVLSLGMGIKGYITSQVESFGTDIIEIESKVPQVSAYSTQNFRSAITGAITTFKLDDAESVAKIQNVSGWYAANISQAITNYGSTTKQALIYATTSGLFQVDQQTKIAEGTTYTDSDDRSLRQVVVLGSAIKDTLFGQENAIGKDIKIKGSNYRVIGVLQERGATGFFNFDDVIYMPLQTYQKKLAGIDYIQAAIFKLKDKNMTDATISEATYVMDRQHNIDNPDKEDFEVMSITEMTNILNKVFLIINILLISLTSISLIVGGVGIMNVMYVSVIERTAEIGLRKSVGARNSNVMKQFLFEAIFITIIGGVVGIFVGAFITYFATRLALNAGFAIAFGISWYSILIGVGFSLITGIGFGLYPARKASQLSPIEALRKE